MIEKERKCWAAWHPVKGFGHYIQVETDLDACISDCKANMALDEDNRWVVVPVIVKRANE